MKIKNLNQTHLLTFLLIASILALSGAYISQYFFGMQPCQLCFWQRKPFWIIIILASVFLVIPNLRKYQNWGIKIVVLLLLINAGIALYHTGVEQKWFKGLESCSSISEQPTSLEDLKLALKKTKAVRCDKPQFAFLHLSMAAWNVLYCLGLAVLVFFAGVLRKRDLI
jgi:disulfide bond formation protein DsbB